MTREQGLGASLRDRATAVEPVPVSPLRDGIAGAFDRDAILLEVAGWVEEMDIRVLGGIMHRRKREREDAALRIKTSEEVRLRMAAMIRGRMENKVGDPVEFLSDVKRGRFSKCCTGYNIRTAIPLADRGLLRVYLAAEAQIAGRFTNTIGVPAEYRIELTELGEQFLAQAIEAGTAETAGLGPKDESAVAESHAPKGNR